MQVRITDINAKAKPAPAAGPAGAPPAAPAKPAEAPPAVPAALADSDWVDQDWLQKQLGRTGAQALPPPPAPELSPEDLKALVLKAVGGSPLGLVHSITGKLQDIASAGGNVLFTTADAIAARLIPQSLLNRIPGHRADIESHADASKDFGSVAGAQAAYQQASRELLDVNQWGDVLAKPPAPPQRFELYDAAGHAVDRPARAGDYVKIIPLVPLPGEDPNAPVAANWVHIDAAGVSGDRTQVVVRPSKDPTGVDPAPIAHVFDSRATNTFTVERDGTSVRSTVHGEHEYANTGAEAGSANNRFRNRLAAEALWGFHVHVNLFGHELSPSPQQLLWDSFTSHLAEQPVGTPA